LSGVVSFNFPLELVMFRMKFITPYNTEWPARFKLIARFLRKYIPSTCLIHHIGSTSVPGMPAKDIIDIDIECPNGSMPSIIEALDKAGYDHEGDLGIPTREAFKPRDGTLAFNLPLHHLYAFARIVQTYNLSRLPCFSSGEGQLAGQSKN
jgi:GrpB-like predicted nucleotidyltransferase (UPF0157 family)